MTKHGATVSRTYQLGGEVTQEKHITLSKSQSMILIMSHFQALLKSQGEKFEMDLLFKTESRRKKLIREDFQVLTNILLEQRTGWSRSQHGEAGKRCANAARPSQH